MSDELYIKLREILNKNSIGFPRTDSGVELKILKKLYTEDDIDTILKLNLTSKRETVDQIAKRTGLDKSEFKGKLESMSKEGLVFRIKRGGTIIYNLAPFMIGLYEYSVNMVDEDLAKLYR